MDNKTIMVINLSILFLLLSLFETTWSKIGDDCGDIVLTYALMHKTFVSKECCTKLIQSGRTCHSILIEPIVESAKQFAKRRPQIVERQNEVWMKCEKDGQVA